MKEETLDHSHKFTWLFFTVLFAFVSGAMAKVVFVGWFEVTPSRSTEVWGYDPANGTEEDNIRKNFNLHRGRWWNYYERGSWYLAYGYYKAAESDFREVVKKRPTDKRDCRTYGMHFRDCFAHRELGIILYYRAIQEKTKTDRLSLLEKSIKEIEKSLKQAESSRAAFFLNLSKESLWKAKDEDVTAPAITVENAIRSGENWAVVFCNPRTVHLDIRVTDDQSGVGAIWVNEERLFVERSAPTISKTVHIPIDAVDPWIVVHAKDLVGNDSPPILVKVELDIKPPVIFGTIDPRQIISDGLITAKYSARDDLGLSTIQIDNQKIDCNGRRKYDIVIQIKAEPGKSSTELQATDLAGNTTKSEVDLLSKDSLTKQHVNPTSHLARFIYINQGLWSTHAWPRAFPAFLRDNTFNLAVRTPAYDMQEIYLGSQVERATRAETPLIIFKRHFPVFEFDNYREVPGGYLVTDAQYELQGKPKHSAGVTGIAVGDYTIDIKPHHDENTFSSFSKIVPFQDYGEKKVEVKALYADGTAVPHATPLTFRRDPHPITEPDSVYSVIVLPLIPLGTPSKTRPGSQYPSLWDAVVGCKLYDPIFGEYHRFDCRKMQGLDRNTLKTDLREPTPHRLRGEVRRLGRKLGVDLGICGYITERNENLDIKIYIEDIEKGASLAVDPNKNPIDVHGPKDKFDPYYLNLLIDKLKDSIPLVYGEVIEIKRKRIISVSVGKQKGLFPNQKLYFFEKETVPSGDNLYNRLAQATVVKPLEGRSEVKVAVTDHGKNPLLGLKADDLFIKTK